MGYTRRQAVLTPIAVTAGVVNDAYHDFPRTDRFTLVVILVPLQKKQSSKERRIERKNPKCNDRSLVPDWIYTRRKVVLTPIAVTAGVVNEAYDDPPCTDRFALLVLLVPLQKKQSCKERIIERKNPKCNDRSLVLDWIYTRRKVVLTPIAVTAGVVNGA